jgi:hypothetical protein
MLNFRIACAFLLSVAVLVGCHSREAPQRIVAPPGVQLVKTALEEIAATGELGAPAQRIKEFYQSLAEDPSGLLALKPDCDQLMSLSDPTAIKAKAREIAEKLERSAR